MERLGAQGKKRERSWLRGGRRLQECAKEIEGSEEMQYRKASLDSEEAVVRRTKHSNGEQQLRIAIGSSAGGVSPPYYIERQCETPLG